MYPRGTTTIVRLIGTFVLATMVTWPLVLTPTQALLGLPTIDAQDTVMLRGLLAGFVDDPSVWPDTTDIYWPFGYAVGHLTPNILDHLTAAPLVRALPFPLADNLWWFGLLWMTGWAGHRFGRVLGGNEGAGWLCAVALVTSEPVLREANLHHAPQAMVLFGILYLTAIARNDNRSSLLQGLAAGFWLAMTAHAYWYYALFIGLGTLPLLLQMSRRKQLTTVLVAAACTLPLLLPQLLEWKARPLTSGATVPPPATAGPSYEAIPQEHVFSAMHGNDLLWWWNASPIDVSNRVSLALVLAALIGSWYRRRRRPGSLPTFIWMVALAGLMLMGPYLRIGEDLVVFDGNGLSMPFQWLRELHPVFARLTWPERWGWLVPLGLAGIAARTPRPALFAVLILLENVLFSQNFPVATTDVRHQRCWARLRPASGAIVTLPFHRGGLRASEVGVIQRHHGRPLVNSVMLPPGAKAPEAWRVWLQTEPLMLYLQSFESGQHPDDPGPDAIESLRRQGVSAIAVDVEPGKQLTAGGVNRYRAGLGRHLGPPIDMGCALVWWIDRDVPAPAPVPDGDAWRSDATSWKTQHPVEPVDSLIVPTWDRLQQPSDDD